MIRTFGNLRLEVLDGVGRYPRETALKVCGHLSQMDCRHKLRVRVVPGHTIVFRKTGQSCFGAFTHQTLTILAAGHLPSDILCDVLCHEFAHYEQWRDKRKLQERGVRVRARSLARRMGPMPQPVYTGRLIHSIRQTSDAITVRLGISDRP